MSGKPIIPGISSRCTGHFCDWRDRCGMHVKERTTITREFTPQLKAEFCQWFIDTGRRNTREEND